MEKRRARKAVKRLPRTAGAGESRTSRASKKKKRLADALRRNLGKRRDQARGRTGAAKADPL